MGEAESEGGVVLLGSGVFHVAKMLGVTTLVPQLMHAAHTRTCTDAQMGTAHGRDHATENVYTSRIFKALSNDQLIGELCSLTLKLKP